MGLVNIFTHISSKLLKTDSHSFGWDIVNFLCRGSYDVMFWIFDEKNGDKTPNETILNCFRSVLIQSQGLSWFSCCPASEEVGVHKKLGADTARTKNPN